MNTVERFFNWLDPIPPEHQDLAPAFDATIQAYMWDVIPPFAVVGGLIMLLNIVNDYLLYKAVFWRQFPLRLGMVAACWLTAALAYRRRGQGSIYRLSYGGTVATTVIAGLMLVATRDPTGPYWVFIFLMAIISVTIPWPAIWAIRSSLTLLAIHLIAGVLGGALASSPAGFFVYSFILLSLIPVGIVALHRPMVHLRWNNFIAQQQLTEARQVAEAATDAKNAFFAAISRDIRTPMNNVSDVTNWLLDTDLTPEQREFTKTIRDSGEALQTIIGAILDFAEIEAGKMELETQPIDLRQIVKEGIDRAATKAAEKGLTLSTLIEARTPSAIVSDPTRLRQIMGNLLSNASKFTHRGEVILSVSAQALPPPSEGGAEGRPWYELHFAVRDTGIGISPELMERLFQPFSQVDASLTREYGGMGLGLALSKRLAELMGGTMWAESEVGKGSTFHFTIQAQAVEGAWPMYLEKAQPKLRGKRVLVVEDDLADRKALILQTQDWGMVAVAVGSGSEALELIQRGEQFDLAILDMQMEEVDGLALASEIRRACPLVTLSLSEPHGEKVECAAFLTKPIEAWRLYNVLMTIFAEEAQQ